MLCEWVQSSHFPLFGLPVNRATTYRPEQAPLLMPAISLIALRTSVMGVKPNIGFAGDLCDSFLQRRFDRAYQADPFQLA
jgi:hypothetical protein